MHACDKSVTGLTCGQACEALAEGLQLRFSTDEVPAQLLFVKRIRPLNWGLLLFPDEIPPLPKMVGGVLSKSLLPAL